MPRKNEKRIYVNNCIPLAPFDFYMKSRLQNILSRPSRYFAITTIYSRKKMDHSLEHYQTTTKDKFKKFDWTTTDYLAMFAHRAQTDGLFFEKNFYRELFFEKKSAHFLVCDEEKILL